MKGKQTFKVIFCDYVGVETNPIHVIYENVLRFLFIPSSFKIKPFFMAFLGVGVLSVVSTAQWVNWP